MFVSTYGLSIVNEGTFGLYNCIIVLTGSGLEEEMTIMVATGWSNVSCSVIPLCDNIVFLKLAYQGVNSSRGAIIRMSLVY